MSVAQVKDHLTEKVNDSQRDELKSHIKFILVISYNRCLE